MPGSRRRRTISPLAIGSVVVVVTIGTGVALLQHSERERSATVVAEAGNVLSAESARLANSGRKPVDLLSTVSDVLQRSTIKGSHPTVQELADFLESLTVAELQDMLRLLEGIDESHRERLRNMLLAQLARSDPRTAAAWAENLEGGARESALRLVLNIWIQDDTRGAASWLERFRGEARDALLDGLIARWSETGFDEALDWARSRADSPFKERALVHLSYRWLQIASPREAVEYAARMQSATHQLLNTLTSQWARRDPSGVADWAVQLPEGPQRTQAIATLTAAWAQTSPQTAADFAARLPDGEARVQAVISAVSGWARASPAEAVRWAVQFPDEGMRALALAHTVPVWTKRDSVATAEWLLQLSEGTAKDAAFDAFSGAVAEQHPAIAFSFAQSIADPDLRRRRIAHVARQWLAVDSETATGVLRGAELPRDIAERLLPAHTSAWQDARRPE